MTGAKILDLLMARLGNKTEPEFRTLCLLEMQLAQETQLEGGPNLPWFLEATDVLQTTISAREIALPDDFIREVDEDRSFTYTTSDGSVIKLEKKGYDELFEQYHMEEGAPTSYALLGNSIAVFPLADDAYTIQLPAYYAREAPPEDNATENAWLKWAGDLVIATTGEVMLIQHLQSENMAMMESFVGMKIRATKRLEDMQTARMEANRSRTMG